MRVQADRVWQDICNNISLPDASQQNVVVVASPTLCRHHDTQHCHQHICPHSLEDDEIGQVEEVEGDGRPIQHELCHLCWFTGYME
jgi:hypothetical protein